MIFLSGWLLIVGLRSEPAQQLKLFQSFIPLAFCKDSRNNKNKHMVKVTFEVICVFLGYCLDHRKTTTQLLGITVSSQ